MNANYLEDETPTCLASADTAYTLNISGDLNAVEIINNQGIYLDGTFKPKPKGKGNSQKWKFTKTTIGTKP